MSKEDTSRTGAKGGRRLGARAAATANRLDKHPALLVAVQRARALLPGDSEFGDPLSTAGNRQPHVVGRHLSELTERRPGVLRETGLAALQLWEAISEAQGRGRGDRRLAIVFTDLAAFSDWALAAGDEQALRLLREVDRVIEPAVRGHGGEVVKRLGDGMMAVFEDPTDALEALIEARQRVAEIQADGYRPRLRAGLHVGRPRKLGGDYFGVDVNIAARLGEHASPDEVLVSDSALALLNADELNAKKKRRFRVKGIPSDLAAYAVTPPSGT